MQPDRILTKPFVLTMLAEFALCMSVGMLLAVVPVDAWYDREQHPDGHAERELRQHRQHERLRQDAVRLHRPIQAQRPRLAGLIEHPR